MTNNFLEFKRPNANPPESPEEAQRRAELAKQQGEAAEFADAKEAEITESGVPLKLRRPDDKLATQVAEGIGATSETLITPTETGLHPIQQEKLQRSPVDWIRESIGDPRLGAHQKMLGLIKAKEQMDENEELKKAA